MGDPLAFVAFGAPIIVSLIIIVVGLIVEFTR